ncbi:hypothetical protein KJ980_00010 [Patescibacteria group bacterium]|nr:hypothetical protein [Patescibacteria group bacterium]
MSIARDAFVKIGEYKYIVKSNAEDINKLTDYLAGLFFKLFYCFAVFAEVAVLARVGKRFGF